MESKNKRTIIITAILAVVLTGNLMRNNSMANIRTVDFLQVFVCGILIGVMLMNIVNYMRARSNKNS